MGTGGRRDSQHAIPDNTYENVASSSAPSMGTFTGEHYARTQFTSPADTSITRNVHDRAHGSSISPYSFHDQHASTHHLQSTFPLQTAQTNYTSYLQDSLRSTQMPPPPPNPHYSQYQMDYMLPPVQQNTQYDPIPQYQERRGMSQGVVAASQYSMVSYMPPSQHASIDVGPSPPQYMMVPTHQTAFETVNRSQPESSYQILGQQDLRQPQRPEEDNLTGEQDMQEYEQEMRTVFDAIVAGRVTEAAEKLLDLSRWLLSSVEQLKLHHDNESLHDQRVLMWREFNHAWEALGQKQKILTQEMLTTRQRVSEILTVEDIMRIMNEFVALCDKVEPFALVDYELGVWEEQIVGIFILCLELMSQFESSAIPGTVANNPR